MSITAIDDVQYRPFAGYDDPSLPSGSWFGRVQLVGDASGGSMIAQLDFTKASELFNSRFYSLEDFITTKNTNTVAAEVGVTLLNMGDRGHSGNTPSFRALITPADPLAVTNPPDVEALRGRWLGQQIQPNTLAALRLQLDNENATLVTMFCEGYFWAARAVNAPGGPSKPLQGLYSR